MQYYCNESLTVKKILLFIPLLFVSCSQDNPIKVPVQGHSDSEKINFNIKIENISKSDTLKISDGKNVDIMLKNGVWSVYSFTNPLFTLGQKNNSTQMEKLVEDGETFSLNNSDNIVSFGSFNEIPAGKSVEVSFSAKNGDKFTFATMFNQSNDLFYSSEGIELFDKNKEPISGDITSQITLYDLGTEVNQEPGSGNEQQPRQASVGLGKSESNNVQRIDDIKDGFIYPKTSDILKVTLTNDDHHEH